MAGERASSISGNKENQIKRSNLPLPNNLLPKLNNYGEQKEVSQSKLGACYTEVIQASLGPFKNVPFVSFEAFFPFRFSSGVLFAVCE
jgi:hypothetical protein